MRRSIEKQVSALGWILHGVGVAALALCVAANLWFVAMPLYEQHELSESRIAQLQVMLSKSKQVYREHEKLYDELASLKKSVEETQKRLPRELGEGQFLEDVRAVAARMGVVVGEYHLGTTEELESYSKAELTLQCQGNYASICRFLDEIDHFARLTEVSNLQIESTDNFNRYPFQVSFVLYFGGSNHDRSMRGDVL
jgi:Tfp pilus assembly protein PilO